MRYKIDLPISDRNIVKDLRVGDEVYLSGIVVTSRDMAHKFYYENIDNPKFRDLLDKIKNYVNNGAIYHCGPITDVDGKTVISAGPTTSIREEPYEYKIIEFFKPAFIIGKGGMGDLTLDALSKYSCCYLHFVGGAGSFYAEKVKIIDRFFSEFGMPESVWVLKVEELFGIVTMDSNKNDLHKKIREESKKIYTDLSGF